MEKAVSFFVLQLLTIYLTSKYGVRLVEQACGVRSGARPGARCCLPEGLGFCGA